MCPYAQGFPQTSHRSLTGLNIAWDIQGIIPYHLAKKKFKSFPLTVSEKSLMKISLHMFGHEPNFKPLFHCTKTSCIIMKLL